CSSPAATTPAPSASAGPSDSGTTGRASPPATAADSGPSPPALMVPAALPVFPGALAAEPTDPWAIAAWTVDEQPPDVYEFYVGELPPSGFLVEHAAPGGQVAIIRFSSADGTSYQLDLTGAGPVHLQLGAPHD
ncbi:MAG TPA: hypothetical protein VK838_05820, partial [Candidatus Limnocylindrales bacterium]|nr:hypothetical protein [Candidatus Limnocylindrales bacterium]